MTLPYPLRGIGHFDSCSVTVFDAGPLLAVMASSASCLPLRLLGHVRQLPHTNDNVPQGPPLDCWFSIASGALEILPDLVFWASCDVVG